MKEKRNWYDYTIGICLIIILAVIPLFVSVTNVDVTMSESYIRSGSTVMDVFSYYKSQMICFTAFFMACIFFMDVPEKGYRKYNWEHPIFFCGFGFILFVIISFIMTPYKDIALKGISERYESMWVLISYMLFMIITFKYCKNEFRMKFILCAIFAGAFIIGIIGFFQYFGMDFFETTFGTKYILGSLYKEGRDPIKANFDDVYSLLYNPNCAGMFCALLLPFTSALAISLPINKKNILSFNVIIKACSVVLSVILVYNLIGSASEGGIIATFIAFCFGALVAVLYIFKNKKYKECSRVFSISIAALIVILISGAGYYVASNESIQQKIKQNIDILTGQTQAQTNYYFQDFNIDNDKNIIDISTFEKGENSKLYVAYNEESKVIEISDDSQKIKEFEFSVDAVTSMVNQKQNNFNITTTKGTNLQINVYLKKNNTIPVLNIRKGKVYLRFRVSDDGKISIIHNRYEDEEKNKDKDIYDPNKKADKFGFEGSETFGTGRGYIWSRSIPLVFEKFISGNGPDSFSVVFPQYELKEKLMYLGNPYVIVDKPHNFYLQTAINTGILSLSVLVFIFIAYIYRTIRSILRDNVKNRLVISLRFAFLMGIVGYLIAALATDSTVSVSPTFWVMFGAGFAVTEYSEMKCNASNKEA